MTPALARLESEGLSRLRARHAESWRGFPSTFRSPEREELKSRADRLNPDMWVTEAEVTLGIEEYETVLESFRSILGRRQQKRRRRRNGRDGVARPEQQEPDGSCGRARAQRRIGRRRGAVRPGIIQSCEPELSQTMTAAVGAGWSAPAASAQSPADSRHPRSSRAR